ncbi:MAG: hypothetical protein EBX40_06800, partial [Gammaproteobacteria bacterium]|nr:hypothetical protein [Gammaproteobacteria bacterium]
MACADVNVKFFNQEITMSATESGKRKRVGFSSAEGKERKSKLARGATASNPALEVDTFNSDALIQEFKEMARVIGPDRPVIKGVLKSLNQQELRQAKQQLSSDRFTPDFLAALEARASEEGKRLLHQYHYFKATLYWHLSQVCCGKNESFERLNPKSKKEFQSN